MEVSRLKSFRASCLSGQLFDCLTPQSNYVLATTVLLEYQVISAIFSTAFLAASFLAGKKKIVFIPAKCPSEYYVFY
jgi:hypothetical protein